MQVFIRYNCSVLPLLRTLKAFMPKALILIILLLSISPALAEDEAIIFSRADSFSYSEGTPVTSYLQLIIGPPPAGGEHAFSRNRFEFGMRLDRFELSFIHRNDYNLDFSKDTADFAWRRKNRKPIEYGKVHDIDVWANQYQLSGLRLAYEWDVKERFTIGAGVSYLIATESIYGYFGKNPDGSGGLISLELEETQAGLRETISGDLYTEYFYSRDPFFERPVRATDGRGYSLDLNFEWRVNADLTLDLLMEDVLGEIYWEDLPHTIATATSDIAVFDEEGFLTANSYFAGTEDYQNLKQPLVNRERLRAHYLWNKWYFGYELDHMKVVDLHRLAAGYRWGNGQRLTYAYEVTSGAHRINWGMLVGELTFHWDTFDFDNAYVLGLGWVFQGKF